MIFAIEVRKSYTIFTCNSPKQARSYRWLFVYDVL